MLRYGVGVTYVLFISDFSPWNLIDRFDLGSLSNPLGRQRFSNWHHGMCSSETCSSSARSKLLIPQSFSAACRTWSWQSLSRQCQCQSQFRPRPRLFSAPSSTAWQRTPVRLGKAWITKKLCSASHLCSTSGPRQDCWFVIQTLIYDMTWYIDIWWNY